jgi:hypothetical protein
MPGGHERFKNTTGCHTSALGELFISRPAQKCKGVFEESDKFIELPQILDLVLLPSVASSESLSALGIWFFRPYGRSNFLDNAHSSGRGLHFSRTAKTTKRA